MRHLQAHMLLYRWGWVYTKEATQIQVAVAIHSLAYSDSSDNTLPGYF